MGIIAGLFGMGLEEFIMEPPSSFSPLQLVAFLTFILGVGVGPLLAWRER